MLEEQFLPLILDNLEKKHRGKVDTSYLKLATPTSLLAILAMVSSSNDREWIHFSVDATTIHHCLLLCSFICILLAGYAAQREQILPMDNFGNKSEWFLKPRSRFTNSTVYMSETIAAQNSSHPLHKLHRKKLIRYDFGTTFKNFCHQKALPQGWLPSLPRVLEMKIAPQALLRLAVLLGLIKFILCLIRCASILKLLEGGGLVRLLCRAQPILELFSSAVLVTMTSLHQEQDRSVKWVMPYIFPLFSTLYLLNGTLSITLDIIDPKKTFSSKFFNVKVSCLIAYSVCAPTVHETLLDYYNAKKPCHTYVPYRSAVAEYACILSLLVFSLSQFDLNGLSGLRIMVPSLPDDHMPTCSADYAPAVFSIHEYSNKVNSKSTDTPIVL